MWARHQTIITSVIERLGTRRALTPPKRRNTDGEFKHENRNPVVTAFCYHAIKWFPKSFFKVNPHSAINKMWSCRVIWQLSRRLWSRLACVRRYWCITKTLYIPSRTDCISMLPSCWCCRSHNLLTKADGLNFKYTKNIRWPIHLLLENSMAEVLWTFIEIRRKRCTSIAISGWGVH